MSIKKLIEKLGLMWNEAKTSGERWVIEGIQESLSEGVISVRMAIYSLKVNGITV